MNGELLRTTYLSTVGERLEVTETERGYVVWAPLFYSDGDGVTLSVYPSNNGWLVTDEASTLAHLADSGANVKAPSFAKAWADLAKVGEFVPGPDADSDCIQAWADDSSLGEALCDVAEAALRAEGLVYASDKRVGPRPFRYSVQDRLKFLTGSPRLRSRGLTSGGGKMRLQSGREASFTDTLVRENLTVVAIQALGGQNKDSRAASHNNAYTMFSQASTDKENNLAVFRQVKDWDIEMVREIEAVAEVVTFDEFDSRINGIADEYPQIVPL